MFRIACVSCRMSHVSHTFVTCVSRTYHMRIEVVVGGAVYRVRITHVSHAYRTLVRRVGVSCEYRIVSETYRVSGVSCVVSELYRTRIVWTRVVVVSVLCIKTYHNVSCVPCVSRPIRMRYRKDTERDTVAVCIMLYPCVSRVSEGRLIRTDTQKIRH